MINLCATKRGDMAPASSLTEDEAIELYESGLLLATDVLELQPSARYAVLERFRSFDVEARLSSAGNATIWGRKRGDDRPVIDGGEA